jgi:hypothetical protein
MTNLELEDIRAAFERDYDPYFWRKFGKDEPSDPFRLAITHVGQLLAFIRERELQPEDEPTTDRYIGETLHIPAPVGGGTSVITGYDPSTRRAVVAEPPADPDYKHLYQCEVAHKAVMQCEIDSLKADVHAVQNSAETLEALKTAHQALLEVAHAQDAGPEWYTRGASGLRQQVSTWVRRGLDALNKTRPVENRQAEPKAECLCWPDGREISPLCQIHGSDVNRSSPK